MSAILRYHVPAMNSGQIFIFVVHTTDSNIIHSPPPQLYVVILAMSTISISALLLCCTSTFIFFVCLPFAMALRSGKKRDQSTDPPSSPQTTPKKKATMDPSSPSKASPSSVAAAAVGAFSIGDGKNPTYIKRIRGSDAFWRQKRAELYNWIHYHLGEGHGAPNGFFTLSCAEYFWPDMIRLLEDRIWVAEGKHRNGPGAKTDRHGNIIDLANDRKARNKAVNDYAIVIQEFFIHRTEDYLNTIGRDVLGIEHYWLRFEFAKGRGQIHAHILVMLKKNLQARIQEQVDAAKGNREKEAQAVAKWAQKQFGMTAQYNEELVTGESEQV